MKNNQLVLSAIGRDQPGIVDQISQVIYELDCNILDSRMSLLGNEFALLMLISGAWNQLARLENQIPELEKKLGLTIIARHTQPYQFEAGLIYHVEVVAIDHPGIVHRVAHFFSSRQINIIEMQTERYAAAHTGTPMFALTMKVNIPANLNLAQIKDEFFDFCDQFNLDVLIEVDKKGG